MNDEHETVVDIFDFDDYKIIIWELQFGYEYQIMKGKRMVMKSEEEYRLRVFAIRDAFGYLADNRDLLETKS